MEQQKPISRWLLSPAIRLFVPCAFLLGLGIKHFVINSTLPSFASLLKCQIGIYYFWCGLIVLGFAHAWLKFQIPTLNYPVLFDVGRHLFALQAITDALLSVHLLFNWLTMFFVVCDPQVASRLFADYQTAPRSYVACQSIIRPTSSSAFGSFTALQSAIQSVLSPIFSSTVSGSSDSCDWLAAINDTGSRLLNGLDHFGGAYLHLIPLFAVLIEWIFVYPSLLRRAGDIVTSKQYPLPTNGNYGRRMRAIFTHVLAISLAAIKLRFAFVAGNAVLAKLLSLPQ